MGWRERAGRVREGGEGREREGGEMGRLENFIYSFEWAQLAWQNQECQGCSWVRV